jgi:endo-1,4-beta-xylanase
MDNLSRRKFVTKSSATLAALATLPAAPLFAKSLDDSGLAEVFKDDFRVGTAISTDTLANNNKKMLALIAQEFNTITAENDMKWEMMRPSLDQWDWKLADRFVDFGSRNQMLMVGHALVWHSQIPDSVFFRNSGKAKSREELLTIMEEHISTVVDRYKNHLAVWDVVNEAVDVKVWRKSHWHNIIGSDYFEHAFRFARNADPSAHLIYNDYSMDNPDKQRFVVGAVKKLRKKGVTVDGVGMQLHAALDGPSVTKVEAAILRFARAGLRVHITELDLDVLPQVSDYTGADISTNYKYAKKLNPYTAGLPESIEAQHTKRYTELFQLFVKHRDKIDRISTWGTTDGESWKNGWPIKGRTNYPLLFDRAYRPKPAYFSIKDLKLQS